jgi:hypothetical protein
MRAPRVNPSIWTKRPRGALSDRIGPQFGDVLTTADDTTQTLRRSDQIKPAILVTSAASAVIRVASIMGISILLGAPDNPFGFV